MILPNEIIKLKRNYNVKQMVKKYNVKQTVKKNKFVVRNYYMEIILDYCIKYKNKELTNYFLKYYNYHKHGVSIYKSW